MTTPSNADLTTSRRPIAGTGPDEEAGITLNFAALGNSPSSAHISAATVAAVAEGLESDVAGKMVEEMAAGLAERSPSRALVAGKKHLPVMAIYRVLENLLASPQDSLSIPEKAVA